MKPSVIPDDQKVIRSLLGMPDPATYVSRRYAPHLHCGICQEPFADDERTTVVDDEKVHVACRDELR